MEYNEREMINRIINLMAEKGMNGKGLAKALGLPFSTIYTWLRYQSEPKAANIVAIAKLFRISTDYLLTGAVPSDEEKSYRSVKAKSEKEQMLLDQYRSVPEKYQDMILAYTNGVYIGVGKQEGKS